MISLESLLACVAASIVLVLIPGPTVVFVVSRALTHGRRAALSSVAGNSTGVVVVVAMVAFGLGSVVERSLIAFTVIKLVGAAYLVYLGVRAYRERGGLASLMNGEVPVGSAHRVYRQGVLVGLTNPKSLVFFAAVLPQFVDAKNGHVPLQMLILGLVFVAVAMVLDSMWGLAAGVARDWFARSPRRLSVLGGTGGLMMIGLGLGLAVSGRKD
ncbi:LysE family translocator [Pseudonocardia spinosispora]|uniref:LysE family translocator n=1 Tax=Pseudonocardia spinosispora TaxID=103441 RepID=UPI00048C2158|nr:LysE family translocator [Pseudonocardia spinosispora]